MSEFDEEREPERHRRSAGWLTTWADLMSVLLTFFIVLQAFSTISEKKFFEGGLLDPARVHRPASDPPAPDSPGTRRAPPRTPRSWSK